MSRLQKWFLHAEYMDAPTIAIIDDRKCSGLIAQVINSGLKVLVDESSNK